MRETLREKGVVASLVLLAPSVASAQAVEPGTYRLWLCAEACTPDDSLRAVAVAMIVILDDSTARAQPARSELTALPTIGSIYEPAAIENACFRVTHRGRRIGNEELYFGIQPFAATVWRYTAKDGFSLRVYWSVDAGYVLRWSSTGPLTFGEGWSYGWRPDTPPHRNAYFAAMRLGGPDLDHCSE